MASNSYIHPVGKITGLPTLAQHVQPVVAQNHQLAITRPWHAPGQSAPKAKTPLQRFFGKK